jgi:RNA polymerase sigma-70 factor
VSEGVRQLARERHRQALAVHGDLGVGEQAFEDHLRRIVKRYLGSDEHAAAAEFASTLHTNDLMLALACALERGERDAGWRRLLGLYHKYIEDLGRHLGRPASDPEECECLWADLFLSSKGSDQPRIASYDGRSSLATWLRVVVSHRVINERLQKGPYFNNLDEIPEPADPDALPNVETRLGLHRYGPVILDCLECAFSTLASQDRLIILLRYDQDLQLGHIARLFSVHQSTITRQIERIASQLFKHIVSLLASRHRLGPEEIEECRKVAYEMLSNSVSILALLKSSVAPDQRSAASSSG